MPVFLGFSNNGTQNGICIFLSCMLHWGENNGDEEEEYAPDAPERGNGGWKFLRGGGEGRFGASRLKESRRRRGSGVRRGAGEKPGNLGGTTEEELFRPLGTKEFLLF